MPVVVTREAAVRLFDAQFGRGASQMYQGIEFDFHEDGRAEVRAAYVQPLRVFSVTVDV